MSISEFDYYLPQSSIAQQPADRREASRMLVVSRSTGELFDRQFTDLTDFLSKGDVLVINNTKVFPARLAGETVTGAKVEIFLVRAAETDVWETLARPAKRLQVGKTIHFGAMLTGEVVEKSDEGRVFIRFEADGDFFKIVDEIGKTPLPPYIKRDGVSPDDDRERYQTVFAKTRGSIAAPTAGLHFTPEILDAIRGMGVTIAEITLHVGYGTFEPVRAEHLRDHIVLPEPYEIDDVTAAALNAAKMDKRRIIAVGTTTTRALESNMSGHERFVAGQHLAALTITPGYEFKAIDALLTNFHLPRSSLLVLTSAFGGRELIIKAYRHAVAANYRFYSYGDCMLIT